jgi:nitroreductase
MVLHSQHLEKEVLEVEIDQLTELVRKRRSIRRYKPDPIPDEYVEKIIEVARWAMSGANGQPWEYIVIKDQKVKEKFLDIYRQHRASIDMLESTRIEKYRHHAPALIKDGAPVFKDAPVFIAVCGDSRTIQASVLAASVYDPETHVFHFNLANTTMLIHLAAASLGLGSQWVSISNHVEPDLRAALGVPNMFRIYVVIPIGYPAYEPPQGWRRQASEITHYDRYDMSKFRSDEQIVEFIENLRKKAAPAYRQLG